MPRCEKRCGSWPAPAIASGVGNFEALLINYCELITYN